MLATGTALGPYLSILQEGKDPERFKNLVLVHAVRYEAGFKLSAADARISTALWRVSCGFITVVSHRETAAGSLTGRIPFLSTLAPEEAVGLLMNADNSHGGCCVETRRWCVIPSSC